MSEFEIKVPELESGGKQYEFVLTSAWLDGALREAFAPTDGSAPNSSGQSEPLRADPAADPGAVSVFAEKSGEDVLVRGRVRTRLIAECARCLAEATVPVDTELTVLFSARGDAFRLPVDEEELTPEELDSEFFTGDTIALDALVREHVLLEVPMQTLCKQTCEGIEVPPEVRGPADLSEAPTHEGKRVDPRLAPLLDLMDKTKKKSSS
ncbi:MAG: DUF177 domain-containing protein [Myxococcota bacterium]|nr:DUF177 domain-containing protein [Myxococcota bacterium]